MTIVKKLLRSWVGLRVRFVCDMYNDMGDLFTTGTEGTVNQSLDGLRIYTDGGRGIDGVPTHYVEVVPIADWPEFEGEESR